MTGSNEIQDIKLKRGYLGNTKLKNSGVQFDWTPEMAKEWIRCERDPIYFCEKYMKIIDVDEGIVPFTMRSYQKKMLMSMVNERDTLGVMCRQSGKTTTYVGFCTWYILFQEEKTIALLANKGETAREILGRIKMAYENLPLWMQHGVETYNEGKFEIENGCRIVAAATSASGIRGYAVSVLIIDEAAHIDNWGEFFTSVYPTISSGKKTKSIFVSTPNGLNHFWHLYDNARTRKNTFNLFDVTWKEVPGRDEAWRERELATLNWDYDKFSQEYENEFLGSSGTLLSGTKLKELMTLARKPIRTVDKKLRIYEEPTDGHKYYIVADVGRGKGLDYSAFSIFDCTQVPYRQVAAFNSNMVHPFDFANIIYSTAKTFSNAAVLIEVNDIGQQVADTISMQFEYPNVLCTKNQGAAGKQICGTGTGGQQIDPGIRTTQVVRSIGCSLAKVLIEQDKILFCDIETINEFATFSRKTDDPHSKYEAEQGKHDDLVMTFVLFAWMTDQEYFKSETSTDPRTAILRESKEEIAEDFPIDIEIVSAHSYWENKQTVVAARNPFNPYAGVVADISDYF